MGDWDSFEWFVHHTQEEVAEGAFLRAVLALRQDDLALCGRCSASLYTTRMHCKLAL